MCENCVTNCEENDEPVRNFIEYRPRAFRGRRNTRKRTERKRPEVNEQPYSGISKIRIKAVCEYHLFGDADPEKFLNARFRANGLPDQEIVFLSSTQGVWGIQHVLFNLYLVVPVGEEGDMYFDAAQAANKIVGDIDVNVLWIGRQGS